MTIEELRQKNNEYRTGLVQAVQLLEDKKQELLDFIQCIKDSDVQSLAYKGGAPASEIKTALLETAEAFLFNVSVIFPLKQALYYYVTKGKMSTDPNTHYDIKFDFDSRIHTSRSIFRLIKQLPEYYVLEELDDVCSDNNDDSILDAYLQQDEDGFVQSFGRLKQNEKDYLIKTFIRIAQALNTQPVFVEIYNKKYKGLSEFNEDLALITPIVDEMLPGSGVLSFKVEDILQNATPLATIQSMKEPYKKALQYYLFRKALMDGFTKDVIEGIIQNPNYIDITKELLAECNEFDEPKTVVEENNNQKARRLIGELLLKLEKNNKMGCSIKKWEKFFDDILIKEWKEFSNEKGSQKAIVDALFQNRSKYEYKGLKLLVFCRILGYLQNLNTGMLVGEPQSIAKVLQPCLTKHKDDPNSTDNLRTYIQKAKDGAEPPGKDLIKIVLGIKTDK